MILYFCTENLGSFVEPRAFGSNVPVCAARRRLSPALPFNVCTVRSVYSFFYAKCGMGRAPSKKRHAPCDKISGAPREHSRGAPLLSNLGSASPQGAYASGRLTAAAALFTPASPFPKKSFAPQNLFWEPYPMDLLGGEQALSCKEPGGLFAACELGNGA